EGGPDPAVRSVSRSIPLRIADKRVVRPRRQAPSGRFMMERKQAPGCAQWFPPHTPHPRFASRAPRCLDSGQGFRAPESNGRGGLTACNAATLERHRSCNSEILASLRKLVKMNKMM